MVYWSYCNSADGVTTFQICVILVSRWLHFRSHGPLLASLLASFSRPLSELVVTVLQLVKSGFVLVSLVPSRSFPLASIGFHLASVSCLFFFEKLLAESQPFKFRFVLVWLVFLLFVATRIILALFVFRVFCGVVVLFLCCPPSFLEPR